MFIEIEDERKFLVREAPIRQLLETKKSVNLLQGYLSDNPPLRVRIEEEGTPQIKSFLMIKRKLMPGSNLEFGDEIDHGLARKLLGLTEHNVLYKKRLDVAGFDLDVFSPKLHGLVLLDIEYEAWLKAGGIYLPPGFKIEEVTGDGRFENHNLAKLNFLPEEWRCRDVSGNL